jgi:hypothetical protein
MKAMNKTEPKIRRGTILDAEVLAPLAVKIFNDTFAGNPLNKPRTNATRTCRKGFDIFHCGNWRENDWLRKIARTFN